MAARFAALFGGGRPSRVLAALITACTPVLIGADHIGNTTPLDLLAWTAVLLCVTTALLRAQDGPGSRPASRPLSGHQT
ncbi:MAG TPA: hypothetical protein VE464_12155 [Streptosporangiaceae bacterium]|jgi:ABC-type dipeptide/oligopeptide/nickel transport system ATPase component|nr:hypothetical protein [Streptosporangiaceae bacterium]